MLAILIFLASMVIPDTIASALPNAKPVWVSAEVAFNDKGDLRKDLFNDQDIQSLAFLRAQKKSDGCAVYIGGSCMEIRHAIDATSLVQADVVGARQGFYAGLPGTLFAIRVVDRTFYVFVNTARIETPKGMICAETKNTPSIGDRIELYAIFDAPDAARSIIPVIPGRTMFVLPAH